MNKQTKLILSLTAAAFLAPSAAMASSLYHDAGGEIGASKYLIWLAAIVLTIALGLLFAPLERIRLPKKRA